MNDDELCIMPDCEQSRASMFLGWHDNAPIWSPYCMNHGPRIIPGGYCPECGNPKSSQMVWPRGVPPAGVVNGKVGTVTVRQ